MAGFWNLFFCCSRSGVEVDPTESPEEEKVVSAYEAGYGATTDNSGTQKQSSDCAVVADVLDDSSGDIKTRSLTTYKPTNEIDTLLSLYPPCESEVTAGPKEEILDSGALADHASDEESGKEGMASSEIGDDPGEEIAKHSGLAPANTDEAPFLQSDQKSGISNTKNAADDKSEVSAIEDMEKITDPVKENIDRELVRLDDQGKEPCASTSNDAPALACLGDVGLHGMLEDSLDSHLRTTMNNSFLGICGGLEVPNLDDYSNGSLLENYLEGDIHTHADTVMLSEGVAVSSCALHSSELSNPDSSLHEATLPSVIHPESIALYNGFYLPPKPDTRPTLVLDLDHTLVYSSYVASGSAQDITVDFLHDGITFTIGIKERPYLSEFLSTLSKHYEIIVFSAGVPSYCQATVRMIDRDRNIEHILDRRHCMLLDSDSIYPIYTKKLDMLGRDLHRTIIVDDVENSYILNYINGQLIPPYLGSDSDDCLLLLKDYLLGCVDLADFRTRECLYYEGIED